MIEGMAQTGGILLGEHFKFEYNVILAKVPKVTFHSWACPGDQLIYTADLQDAKPEGGSVTVTARWVTDLWQTRKSCLSI
jgi:3-hydroxyacyl-[acyl-carrier-protein] dehydratase